MFIINKNKLWEKRKGNCFAVTMGCYTGVETCELVGTYILTRQETI